MLTNADEGGGGVSQMLTIADRGGVQEPLILAEVICEQPLISSSCFIFNLLPNHLLQLSPRMGSTATSSETVLKRSKSPEGEGISSHQMTTLSLLSVLDANFQLICVGC